MIFLLLFAILFFSNGYVKGDPVWKWISGEQYANGFGNFGTLGVPASSNVPGARCNAISYVDSNNSIWVFGGYGYATSPSSGNLNDFWKFDGTNWIWISGANSTNQVGNYGNMGETTTTNIPGARHSAISWFHSESNSLWVYGGSGYDYQKFGLLSDLWKFDGVNWVWILGSNATEQTPNYGAQGIPSDQNTPGSRESSASWIDSQGSLWLYGGRDNNGTFADLWKFNGTYWTWISGSQLKDEPTIFGKLGVPSSTNTPGSRESSAYWIDQNDNLWLFGGLGGNNTNDLWNFNGVNWTWISGGFPSSSMNPGSRYGAASWVDSVGTFWLFGGYGAANTSELGYLEDLWSFNGSLWTWVSGSNINSTGNYGTKGVAAYTNQPRSRVFPSIAFSNQTKLAWVFGGSANDNNTQSYLNDLWSLNVFSIEPVTTGGHGFISQSRSEGSQAGVNAAITIIVIALIVFIASLVFLLLLKRREKAEEKSETKTEESKDKKKTEDLKKTEIANSIELSDIEIAEKLGEGTFTEAFLGKWNSVPVVAKKLRSGKLEKFTNDLDLIHSIGSHPNVVQFLGTFTKGLEEYMIFAYCLKGNLLDFLKKYTSLPLEVHLEMILQVCEGMAFLESKKVVHRDLSLRNCMVHEANGDYVIRVADYGINTPLKESSDSFNLRLAPEVLASSVYSLASDVWAFGIVCWEILNSGADPNQLGKVEHSPEESLKLPPPTHCSAAIWNVIESCFAKDPSARPSFTELNEKFKAIKAKASFSKLNANFLEVKFVELAYLASLDKEKEDEEKEDKEKEGEEKKLEYVFAE